MPPSSDGPAMSQSPAPNAPPTPAPPSMPFALLTRDRLLGRRIYLNALTRYAVAASIVIAGTFASEVVGIEGLDLRALTLIAIAIALYNTPLFLAATPHRQTARDPGELRRLRFIKHAATLLDYLALTAVIWNIGGIRSPFIVVFLFHIIIESLILPVRAAVASAVTASVLLGALALAEVTGWLPPPLPAGAVISTEPLDSRAVVTILVVSLLMIAFTTTLVAGLADLLRRGEQRVLDQAEQLERLSAQRRDLLHLTLHNLQSPVAAAAMLLRNLRHGLCGPLEPAQTEQIDRSLARLDSVSDFIRNLGVLARIESGDFSPHTAPVRLDELVREVADEYADQARDAEHALSIDADRDAVALAVPRLVREAFTNYLTNAIKYTPPGGSIRVAARRRDSRARVEVADTGVGIAPEQRDRIFGEFVRLASRDPRLGRVDGTGLGLSIVKQCIERQGGSVGFESEPGRGSTFWFELPATDAPPEANPGGATPRA